MLKSIIHIILVIYWICIIQVHTSRNVLQILSESCDDNKSGEGRNQLENSKKEKRYLRREVNSLNRKKSADSPRNYNGSHEKKRGDKSKSVHSIPSVKFDESDKTEFSFQKTLTLSKTKSNSPQSRKNASHGKSDENIPIINSIQIGDSSKESFRKSSIRISGSKQITSDYSMITHDVKYF